MTNKTTDKVRWWFASGLTLACGRRRGAWYAVASAVVLVACGSSAQEPGKSAPGSGANTGAAQVAGTAGSGADAAAKPAGPGSVPAAAVPARLALRAGEKLHEPVVETAWNIPGGTVTATVIDAAAAGPEGQTISKLVVWGSGKRYDIVKTVSVCDEDAELRHVFDSRIVFHCTIAPAGGESDARVEDWLIRWSEEKNAPLRNRHWRGEPADTEPRWAAPRPHATTRGGPPTRSPNPRCCCEATMEDITTHAWEYREDCKSDAENETAAFCVTKSRCRGIEGE